MPKNKPDDGMHADGDKENHPDEREDKEMFEGYLQKQAEHHDRLSTIEKHLGIKHKADDMKSEEKADSLFARSNHY